MPRSRRCWRTDGWPGSSVVDPWLPVPEPRRATLDAAIAEAVAIRLDVTNA